MMSSQGYGIVRGLALLALAGNAWGGIGVASDDGSLTIKKDGELVAAYRSDGRQPCIYPLVGPTGTNLTRHWPLRDAAKGEEKDHPHHVSFWLAHGAVNGVDFWAGGEKERIVHQGFTGNRSTSKDGVDQVDFGVNLSWQHDGEEMLTEKRAYQWTFEEEKTVIDVTSTLTASKDLVFGDSKEGFFAIRLSPTLRLKGEVAKGHILDSEGRTDDDCWGKRSAWVAYHGPDVDGNDVTVAMFDAPENLRHPTWWHARDYGLLAANPFGQHDFENKPRERHLGDYPLKKGESFTQNYRLVLAKGTLESDTLKKEFEGFSKKSP